MPAMGLVPDQEGYEGRHCHHPRFIGGEAQAERWERERVRHTLASWSLMLPRTLEAVVPKWRRHTSDVPALARVPVAEPLTGHARPQRESGAVSPGLLFLYIGTCWWVGDELQVVPLLCKVSPACTWVTCQTRQDLLLTPLYRLLPTLLALETLTSPNISF